MNEEQITNRYMRSMISLEGFRSEMVAFYDREDAKDRIDRITDEAYAKRDRNHGDPIVSLVRLAVRIALADAKAEFTKGSDRRGGLLEVNSPTTFVGQSLSGDERAKGTGPAGAEGSIPSLPTTHSVQS